MNIRTSRTFFAASALAAVMFGGSALAAGLETNVVVYSTHGEDMLEVVADAFTKETGVKVEFINLKGELADRVRAEKANPQSDIMYGAPSSVFLELKGEGLFEAFTPSWAADIDPLFKDAEGYWYGTIQTPVVMFYNTEVVARDEAPKDWSDLVRPEYRGQLVFRNGLSSSARATYTALLQQYERRNDLENGWAFLKGLDANTKQYFGSGSLLFQAIGRKEAGIGFAVLSEVVDNKTKNNMPLEMIDAASGSPIITDGIALIRGQSIRKPRGLSSISPAVRRSRPCSQRASTACRPIRRPLQTHRNGWPIPGSRRWTSTGGLWRQNSPSGCRNGIPK